MAHLPEHVAAILNAHQCPTCGATVEVSVELRGVRTVRTYVQKDKSTYQDVQLDERASSQQQPQLPALLVPISKAKATIWKRALAIAHRVIEEHPGDSAHQTDAFKTYCLEQGLDYRLPGGVEDRPLYARALDFVHEQRRRRRTG